LKSARRSDPRSEYVYYAEKKRLASDDRTDVSFSCSDSRGGESVSFPGLPDGGFNSRSLLVSEDHNKPASALAQSVAEPGVDAGELQQQLKRLRSECDRYVTEKSGLQRAADALARERDDLRQRIAGVANERDRLLAEAAAIKNALSEAASRCEAATKDAAQLRQELAAYLSQDSLAVLWALVVKETKAGLGFLRSKIPEGHPGQKWFDLTVEVVTQIGCFAAQASVAFVKWATPRVKELAAKFKSEAEARFAKK
jgi:regulator of replication initiation timing